MPNDERKPNDEIRKAGESGLLSFVIGPLSFLRRDLPIRARASGLWPNGCDDARPRRRSFAARKFAPLARLAEPQRDSSRNQPPGPPGKPRRGRWFRRSWAG